MGEVERPLWDVKVYNKDKYIGKYLVDRPPYKLIEQNGKFLSVFVISEEDELSFDIRTSNVTGIAFNVIELTWQRMSDGSLRLNVWQGKSNLQHLDKFIKMLK